MCVALAVLEVKTNKNWTFRYFNPNTQNLQRMRKSIWYLYNVNNARAILLQKLHKCMSKIMERKITTKKAVRFCTARDENIALIAKGVRTGLTYTETDATEIPGMKNFCNRLLLFKQSFDLNFPILNFWYKYDAWYVLIFSARKAYIVNVI